MNSQIEKAVEIAGGQVQLAKACKVSQPAVFKWLRGGRITAENAIKVETATDGQVTRQDLRPDIFGEPRSEPSAA
jgi:DNA-binding transcriptional regulator YdaS (Cro superfamily)